MFAAILAGGNPPNDWPALLAAAEAPEAVRRFGAVEDEAGSAATLFSIRSERILGRMDAVDREELIGLVAEALINDAAFRPHRRNWAADADRRRIEARTCAVGLVEHLHRCGIRWSRLPPAQPHRTP